ncbi:UNVERIFIED_CONTAM: hypothetical protein FKN15_042187 [Acipenser sinensis]
MVSHDSGVGSQPSAVVEPSAGSEGQEKGGPQPADLVSEDPVLEGSDVGGDSLGAQAGPVDVPPSDETPQPAAGSVAEMPAADGDSAGEEEDGSTGSDEDGWEDGLSDTSQLSDITASQRGKLYSLTEISDFLEKTKEGRDYVVFASTEVFKCFLCGEQGHLKRTCPKLQTEAGTSSRNDDGEAAAVVQRAEVEEPPRPEPRPRRKRPEEPGTSAGAAEPGAAAPADADKEGVFAAVIKKRKLKKRTSAAADPAAGEEESVWGPIMVSHDSDVGSQPSAVVEPSAGSEGQEKGGPQPADLVSEDPVLEGSDVGGDSLGAQAGPVDVPPSDETPQPAAGSVAEMPAADGDSAGEEEDGSAGSDEGTSSRNDDGEAAAVVQRAEVEEPPRPEPRPRRKRPEEPGTSAGAAEPGAAAPADADKEGVFAAVIKKRKLKKRTSAAADPAAGEEESVWGPIMVSHDSDVGSQPSAVVEPSAGSEGQEKGGPQPADLVSEDPVLEGSDVGGDSLGAQAGPVDVPPSDETPQPAGSVAEMPAADGDSAGEEENGSDEDGWEDGLSDTSQLSDITASQRGKLYSLTEISDFLEKTKGTSSRNDDGEAAAVVQRAEVEEPPRPEPRPRRKRPEEPGTSAAAAEPGAAAPADADKEGVFAAVIKKRKLKKRTSTAADPAAGEEESVWGPIMVSHDSDVGSQPSAVVEPSAGSEGQEKGGPQPADLVSEDPVLEGSDVGGDSLGAQAGPVDVPPSDETPQPAGSVAEMPAADGDSAGEEENGSDEDGWEDGLSDTSQLSDITASQRGKLYSLTEISDFLEKTKGKRRVDIKSFFPDQKLFLCSADLILRKSTIIEFEQKKREQGHLKRTCPKLQTEAGTSSSSGDGEAAGVVRRTEVEEPLRPEPQPWRKRAEEPGTSAAAAELGTAAPADTDKEGVYTAVVKKRKLKKRTSPAAADLAAGEEESMWGPIMVCHDSGVGSQPSPV